MIELSATHQNIHFQKINNTMDIVLKIAQELKLNIDFVNNTVELLNEGATIPFIARYRKEATGSMDELMILHVKERFNQLIELNNRKITVLNSIEEQGKLTDALKQKIENIETIYQLEDLYLPYKPKRKTKASIAKEKGLEPLANRLYSQERGNVYDWAKHYVNKANGVDNEEKALEGACDILAEFIVENEMTRAKMRKLFLHKGMITSKVIKGKEIEGNKFEIYFDNNELLRKISSHRFLAMLRGESEGYLRVKVAPNEEEALHLLYSLHIKSNNESSTYVAAAIDDGYKRLLQPQMETEMRQETKIRSDNEAIRVFSENLRQLLLAPPLGEKIIMALDPGFRTGCKVVVIDKHGKLLDNTTIFPHPPQVEVFEANKTLRELAIKYKVEAIAIGNGTASRETENFVLHVNFETKPLIVVVNENGASVYSASDIAREEFPNQDVTVRGAISIGRRLMDPLAELIKIDPKSIGVGQYQHDVNQKKLQESLEYTVESCVNTVGVEINTASKQLLSFVSGIGPTLAENIINYRIENKGFTSKVELKKVKRFGSKSFEQAAGFIRIRDAKNPLDRSAVHPESYEIVEKMAKSLNCSLEDLIEKEELRKKINIKDFVTDKFGIPTLTDIMKELAKPGRDPRQEFNLFEFDKTISNISDLKPGMVLPGVIVNIAAFGCFVDIGVHQDGLVHISQMSRKYIKNPNELVKLNQKVMVKVLEVDMQRKRINLTMNID